MSAAVSVYDPRPAFAPAVKFSKKCGDCPPAILRPAFIKAMFKESFSLFSSLAIKSSLNVSVGNKPFILFNVDKTFLSSVTSGNSLGCSSSGFPPCSRSHALYFSSAVNPRPEVVSSPSPPNTYGYASIPP